MSDDDNDLQPDIARRDYETGSRPGGGIWGAIKGAFNQEIKSGPRVFRGPGYGQNKVLGERGRPGIDVGIGRIDRNGFVLPQSVRTWGNRIFGGAVIGERVLRGGEDIASGRYDVGRARYRDDQEMEERGRGRRSGRDEPSRRDESPRVTLPQATATQSPSQAPVTQGPATIAQRLADIDRAQTDLNTGAFKDQTDSQYVSQADANGVFRGSGIFAQTRAGANEYMNFKRELLENTSGELDQTFRDRPDIRRAVVEQWRREVGADSTSPDYRGGKPTILDKLGEMSRDADRLDALRSSPNAHEFMQNVGGSYASGGAPQPVVTAQSTIRVIDPNDAIGVVTQPVAGGTVAISKTDASAATFTPAVAAATTGVQITSGGLLNTAMLNRLSAEGILAQQTKLGQGADAPRLLVDREGKIHGGYTANDDGTTGKLVSRADLESRFSPQMLAGLEDTLKPKTGRDAGTQVAASNVPTPDAPKPNDLALNMTQSPAQRISPGPQSA